MRNSSRSWTRTSLRDNSILPPTIFRFGKSELQLWKLIQAPMLWNLEFGMWKVLEGAQFLSPVKPLYSNWQGEKLVTPQSRLWPSHQPWRSSPWWLWWWWRWSWHLAVAAVNLWQMSLNWVTFNLGTWVPWYLQLCTQWSPFKQTKRCQAEKQLLVF